MVSVISNLAPHARLRATQGQISSHIKYHRIFAFIRKKYTENGKKRRRNAPCVFAFRSSFLSFIPRLMFFSRCYVWWLCARYNSYMLFHLRIWQLFVLLPKNKKRIWQEREREAEILSENRAHQMNIVGLREKRKLRVCFFFLEYNSSFIDEFIRKGKSRILLLKTINTAFWCNIYSAVFCA